MPRPLHVPDILIGHPISQTVEPGTRATLRVLADTAGEPLTYQWSREQPFDNTGAPLDQSVPIPGATNATLEIAACTAADEGYYSVRATTASGRSETSAMAFLAVTNIDVLRMTPPLALQCCSNNLRQIYLTARLTDNTLTFPRTSEAIADGLGWPMALYCPADSQNMPPAGWNSETLANTSYSIDCDVAADGSNRVLAWCHIHHTLVRASGEVTSPTPLQLQPLQYNGNDVTLHWSGGLPPYRVEAATQLAPPDWLPIAEDLEKPSCQLQHNTAAMFYRVSWNIH
jgi:hypothetical protein